MHSAITLIIVAIMATIVLAAPTPTKTLMKRSFAVPAKGHTKLSPSEAMKRAARKYGFQISFDTPEDSIHNIFDSEYGNPASALPSWFNLPSSIVWVFPSGSAQAYPSAVSSAIAFSSSAVPLSSSYAPISFSSGAPSSSYAAPISSVPASSMPASSMPASSVPASSVPASSVPASSAPPAASSAPPSSGGNGKGEVSASPEQNDSEYLSPVTIGGQKLNLDFDTGSADLWVYSTRMPSSESAGHSTFDPSKSGTWSEYHGSWTISYGDGSTAQGSVGFDTVNVGGAVVQKQCVELAEQVSGSFGQDPNNDGLLGLGFSVINQVQPQPQKTFFENIMGDLDSPVFTANLEEDASGTYEFGSIDSTKYTGDIHYTPVQTESGYWQFDSKTYSIGGNTQSCTTCSPAIADTGTSLILVDQDVADAYWKQVNGAQYSSADGGYVYSCSTTLPDFGVAIGSGYTATVKGADLQYAQQGGLCFGGIQGTGQSVGQNVPQIFGDVLLKQYFAVFDGGQKRFGIAEKP